MYIMFWPLKYFLVPVTNWALMMTTASVAYSYWAASCYEHFGAGALDEKKNKKWLEAYQYQARHHIMYTFSLMFNLMVTAVWWTLIHESYAKKHRNHPVHGNMRELHLITIHIIPPAVCLVNSLMTNCMLRFTTWKTVVAVCVIYDAN